MKKVISAGGIIIRKINMNTEILVIKRHEGGLSFPKGHVETGESPEEAAIREVFEETGYRGEIIKLISIVNRTGHDSDYSECDKKIYYYQMKTLNSDNIAQEHKDVLWKNIELVKDNLLYPSEKEVLFKITV